MRTRPFLLPVAAFLLLAGSPLFALDPDCVALESEAAGPVEALATLNSNLCLGESRDKSPVTMIFGEKLKTIAQDDDAVSQLEALTSALKDLVELAAATLPAGQSGLSPASVMRLEMQRLLREIDAGGEFGSGLLHPDSWKFEFPNPLLPSRPGGVDVAAYINAHCPPIDAQEVPVPDEDVQEIPAASDEEAPDAEANPHRPACPAYVESREAVRFTHLVGRALGTPASLGTLLATMNARDKQWDAYFNEARSQYLWELWLNERWTLKDDRETTETGQPKGFLKVPNRQFIVLHPSVALEYVDDADDGDQLQEAAFAEVFGYNRWKWKEDGSMGRAVGLSLIATVSDRSGTEDFGWGLMLHVNHKYSLAFTDHDGDRGILLSADLAKLWTRISESRRAQTMTGSE